MKTEIRFLMHKNKVVTAVILEDNYPKKFMFEENMNHLPVGVKTINDFIDWLYMRNVPDNRSGVRNLMRQYGLEHAYQLIGISRNVSLTDCYWFATQEDILHNVRWSDVNFFENTCDNAGEILFYGNNAEITGLESPDLTTNGHLKKFWKNTNDGWCLIKEQESYKQEVFGELATYRIAEELEINAVPYDYMEFDGDFYSVCPCLIKDDTKEMVSYAQLRKEIGKNGLQSFLEKINGQKDFENMLILDYIVGNEDRNKWNLSFIRNPDTLEYYGIAPLYDHGETFGYDVFNKASVDINPISEQTGKNSKENFENCHQLTKKINVEKIRKELYEIGEQLKMDNTRLNVVINKCLVKMNEYNLKYDEEKRCEM